MNYEEKYKDALSFLKDLKPHMSDYCIEKLDGFFPELIEKLDGFFPELKESEDERIRKEILYAIQQLDDKTTIYGINYDYQKWIAWLEKQGHDGKKWIYEDVYIKEKEQLIQDGIDEVLENPQKYGLEKQGEQNPVAWSEEDEKMLNSIIYCIDSMYFIDSNQLNWLKSLKPNHWKPSEEQMEALNALNNTSEISYPEQADLLIDLYNDLKKL